MIKIFKEDYIPKNFSDDKRKMAKLVSKQRNQWSFDYKWKLAVENNDSYFYLSKFKSSSKSRGLDVSKADPKNPKIYGPEKEYYYAEKLIDDMEYEGLNLSKINNYNFNEFANDLINPTVFGVGCKYLMTVGDFVNKWFKSSRIK